MHTTHVLRLMVAAAALVCAAIAATASAGDVAPGGQDQFDFLIGPQVPLAQSILMWVCDNLPTQSAQILASARTHYARPAA